MIDLETLNTHPDSIILTIGAIKFDRTQNLSKMEDCDSFYRRIEIESCKSIGLTSSEETIKWWNTQDISIKYEALENPDRIPIKKVLIDFDRWIGKNKKVWAHGDDFDCVILDNAYRACDLKTPWQFWNTRDTRTLFDIANVNINEIPIIGAHNALNDAYRQVKCVKLALSRISVK